jgi:hypothetical protein
MAPSRRGILMLQWQVGDVTITRVVELEAVGGTRFILPDATREACREFDWMQPHFMDNDGNLIMSVHALVIDTGELRIVVDTCIGNDKERSIDAWSHLQTNFLEDLAAAGYPRESIDYVLCTHLHVDHVGWNTMWVNGKWVPTFPKARYLLARKEWSYWDTHEDEADYGPILADSVRPVIDAGLVDLCSSADFDQSQGRQTREDLLAHYANGDTLIIGTHFATPTAGYIRPRDLGGYWLDVDSS